MAAYFMAAYARWLAFLQGPKAPACAGGFRTQVSNLPVRAHTGAPSSGQLGEEASFLPGADGDFDSAQRTVSALSRSELLVHRGVAFSGPATGMESRLP